MQKSFKLQVPKPIEYLKKLPRGFSLSVVLLQKHLCIYVILCGPKVFLYVYILRMSAIKEVAFMLKNYFAFLLRQSAE